MTDFPSVQVIAGLGNPGPEYERTRHNVGFLVLMALAGSGDWVRRGDWLEAEAVVGGRSCVLLRPQTFMNRSGRAIEKFLDGREITPAEVLVVTDDIYLPWGRLRIRPGGSAGGHNGLESIVRSIGTDEFPRLRVGVDSPPPGVALEEFVLAPLGGVAWEMFERIVARAAEATRTICGEGLSAGMNRFNGPAPDDVTLPVSDRAGIGRSAEGGPEDRAV